ncbi:MAG: hypothetical protein RLZZ561_1088 [Pseudomonadota bacterium]|jgi:hypothetical protein
MRKILGVVAVGALLSGCASGGLFNRNSPDEFQVTRLAPLVVPPDFALVPPAAGSAQAQAADSSTQALQAMFGGPAARSGAENAAITAAGGNRAQPGIRSNAGDPKTDVVDKGATTRDIIAAPEGDGQNARATTPQ